MKKKKLPMRIAKKVQSTLAFWGTYVLSLFALVKMEWQGRFLKKKGPIILVHGYMNSGFVWHYHGSRLKKAGFGPVYSINLGSPFLSIEKYVDKLEKKAESVMQETNSKSLVLIGHSMGGLVTTYFALKRAKKGVVSDVITLGTPFHGTSRAILGMGACAKQMRMGSSFVLDLQKLIDANKKVSFYQIATKGDRIVVPYQSALLHSDAKKQYVLEDEGHAAMLFSKNVNRKLITWLSQIYNL